VEDVRVMEGAGGEELVRLRGGGGGGPWVSGGGEGGEDGDEFGGRSESGVVEQREELV
jgi:hypothetical protein